MKKLIGHDVGSYIFDPTNKQITLIGLPIITLEQVLLVTDTTAGTIIYNFSDSSNNGTISNNVITLNNDCVGLSSTDTLQIYIDLPTDAVLLLSTTYSTIGYEPSDGIDIGPVDTSGYSSIIMQVSGVWEGMFQVYVSNDSIHWDIVHITPLDDYVIIDTVTGNGLFTYNNSAKYFGISIVNLVSGFFNLTLLGRNFRSSVSSDNLGLVLDQKSGFSLSTTPGNPGQQSSILSQSVALADEHIQDLHIVGAPSLSVLNTNVLLSSTGFKWLDTVKGTPAVSYRYITIQLNASSGVSAGAITFEGSNDGINSVALYLQEMPSLSSAPVTTTGTLSASTYRSWSGPIPYRYIRARISTAFTGGTVQAFSKLSIYPWVNQSITLAGTPSLNVSQIGGTSVVTGGISGLQAIGGNIGIGVTPTANPIPLGGRDSTTSTTGAATPLTRMMLTDTSGRPSVGIFGIDPASVVRNLGTLQPGGNAFNIAPLSVQEISQFEGQTTPDLLSQILLELRIMNMYLYDLPRQLQQGQGILQDEPTAFRTDPTIFAN